MLFKYTLLAFVAAQATTVLAAPHPFAADLTVSLLYFIRHSNDVIMCRQSPMRPQLTGLRMKESQITLDPNRLALVHQTRH